MSYVYRIQPPSPLQLMAIPAKQPTLPPLCLPLPLRHYIPPIPTSRVKRADHPLAELAQQLRVFAFHQTYLWMEQLILNHRRTHYTVPEKGFPSNPPLTITLRNIVLRIAAEALQSVMSVFYSTAINMF